MMHRFFHRVPRWRLRSKWSRWWVLHWFDITGNQKDNCQQKWCAFGRQHQVQSFQEAGQWDWGRVHHVRWQSFQRWNGHRSFTAIVHARGKFYHLSVVLFSKFMIAHGTTSSSAWFIYKWSDAPFLCAESRERWIGRSESVQMRQMRSIIFATIQINQSYARAWTIQRLFEMSALLKILSQQQYADTSHSRSHRRKTIQMRRL